MTPNLFHSHKYNTLGKPERILLKFCTNIHIGTRLKQDVFDGQMTLILGSHLTTTVVTINVKCCLVEDKSELSTFLGFTVQLFHVHGLFDMLSFWTSFNNGLTLGVMDITRVYPKKTCCQGLSTLCCCLFYFILKCSCMSWKTHYKDTKDHRVGSLQGSSSPRQTMRISCCAIASLSPPFLFKLIISSH